MAQILAFQIVNDVIKCKPIKFIRDVSTQDDIEVLRQPLMLKHKLAEKNKEIDEYNNDPFNNKKKNRYEVLFTIKQNQGEKLQP